MIKTDLVTNEKLEGILAKMELRLVLWIIGSNLAIGGAGIGVTIFLHNQMLSRLALSHWKP